MLDKLRKCEWCGTEYTDKSIVECINCGQKLPEEFWERVSPFFYCGYMVWPERDWQTKRTKVHFWLGERLPQTISFNKHFIDQMVPEYCDPMPFVFDLFKVAQGEQEVLEVEGQGVDKEAIFEIRRHQKLAEPYFSYTTT